MKHRQKTSPCTPFHTGQCLRTGFGRGCLVLVMCLAFLTGCFRPITQYDPWRVPSGDDNPAAPISSATLPAALNQPTHTPIPYETPIPRVTLTQAPAGPTPTANSPAALPTLRTESTLYTVVSGDNLAAIAMRHQVSVAQILKVNDLEDPSLITPDQVLTIPPASANELATAFKTVPDSEIFYGPSMVGFDVAGVIWQFNGKLQAYQEEIEDGRSLTGTQIVQEVADNFSVNPRLLLVVIEQQSGWLKGNSKAGVSESYPLGFKNTNYKGLYKQLGWAANELTRGYTLWENQAVAVWTLADGEVVRIDPTINAGTAAVQYFLGLLLGKPEWKVAVAESGLYATYNAIFGNPFAFTYEPLLPADLQQPELELPLAAGDVWSYTGGPHWGWGTGSTWAALDFAPPGTEEDYGCFESQTPVVAVADGQIVRSGNGAVVLDLDMDGSEHTGWTILYMHIAEQDRIPAGRNVKEGDLIGYASCEGGVSTGTHFHIARRYNGVWIAADGDVPFILGGWVASSLGSVYDGYLTKDGQTIEAFNGRADFNQIGR